MKDASERLKFLRKDVFNLNIKKFCEMFDISYNYMRNIECGQKNLSKSKCIEITKKIQNFGFKLSDEWIEFGTGDFPIHSYSLFRTNKYIDFDDTSFEQRQWLKTILTKIFPFTYACISSYEMSPILDPGDIVFGVKGDPYKNIKNLKDKIVIARIDDSFTFVRRLKNYNNELYLNADNKEHTDIPSIQIKKLNWISPVILVKKPVGKIYTKGNHYENN